MSAITLAQFNEICLDFARRAPIKITFGLPLFGEANVMSLCLFFFPEEDEDHLADAEAAQQALLALEAQVELVNAVKACWVTARWDRADAPKLPQVPTPPEFRVGQRVCASRLDVIRELGRLVHRRLPTRRDPSTWFVRADAPPDENLRPQGRRVRFPWAPSVRYVWVVKARVPLGLCGTVSQVELKGKRADYTVRWDVPVVPASSLAARVEPLSEEDQHCVHYTWWASLPGLLPFTEVPDGQG